MLATSGEITWRPGCNDPDLMGLVITFGYVLAGLLCLAAARTEPQHGLEARRFPKCWLGLDSPGVPIPNRCAIHRTVSIISGRNALRGPLAQGLDKALAIGLVVEDRLAPVAAIQDMVERAGIFDSQLAGHDGRVAENASVVNIKNRPL
jgi:hypothetical protein